MMLKRLARSHFVNRCKGLGCVLRPVVASARVLRNGMANLLDPPVIVLIYHRVTTLTSDLQQLAVTPANFLAQLQHLKDNYPILRFEDDWSRTAEPSVVVTFDDGYADNALEALPILEKVGVPATFFVCTGTLGTQQEFWWDELERVILGKQLFPAQFVLRDCDFGRAWPTASGAERQALYWDIHLLMKKLASSRREQWLSQLREWADVGAQGREEYRSMAVEELQYLASSRLVTIGAHTVTHTPLSSLPEQEQLLDIASSRRQLEALIGQQVTVFSYPFGCLEDYDSTSVRIARDAGFVKVAANFSGQAHRWTDHFQIPRQLVRNWDAQTFARKIKGFRWL